MIPKNQKIYIIAAVRLTVDLTFLIGAASRILWSLANNDFLAGRRKEILRLITLILFFSSLAPGMISFFPAFSSLLLTRASSNRPVLLSPLPRGLEFRASTFLRPNP